MPRLVLALVLATAVFLEAAVLPRLAILQVRPNLVLVLVLLWTVARGGREGAFWAFGVGLLIDALTLSHFGSHALALLVVVPFGVACRHTRFSLGLLLPMAAAVPATIAHDAVLLVLQEAPLATLAPTLLRLSLLGGLLNLAIVPLLAPLTIWLNRWVTRQEETFGRPRAVRPTRIVGRRR